MFVRVWLRDPPACRRKKETGGRRQSAAALGDIAEYGAFERWPSAAPPDRPTRQAVAKHLAVLSRAGLVEGQRQGREVHYTVRPERLDEAAQAMATAAARWDRRLS